MKFYWQHWVSSSKKELVEIQLRFEAYKSVHGDLFEDAVVPLTEEDLVDALARRKRFSIKFLIAYGCLMIIMGVGLIASTTQVEDYFYIIAFIGVPLIYRMIILNGFDNAIKYKEKRVIHGIITHKKMKGGTNIEFSRKLTIPIADYNYKVLKLGDIVRMEILAKDVLIKRKVVVEGRI